MRDLVEQIRRKYNIPIAGAYVDYLRDDKRRPVGCVVGIYGAGKIGVGYSLYHESAEKEAGHPLNKKLGRTIAIGRAVKEWVLGKPKYMFTAPDALLGKMHIVQLKCLERLASIKYLEHFAHGKSRVALVKGAFSWKI